MNPYHNNFNHWLMEVELTPLEEGFLPEGYLMDLFEAGFSPAEAKEVANKWLETNPI